ncbi:MAG: hypothetical protein WBE34_02805 [Candidatus Nitrosopolaris sp.]
MTSTLQRKARAQKLLRDSNLIQKEFVTADAALEKRRSMLRCSALDELLLGGIETQALTEFYGEFGSGKSQICHTLCATARQPIDSGGMDSGVIYIDTEGTFRPERLEQIARARGLDHRHVLKNVAVCKVYNSSHLELIVKDLGKYVNEFKAKLVSALFLYIEQNLLEEVPWPIDNKNSMACCINSLDWSRYIISLSL